jgi:engulfment/cell motility protein 1
LRIANIYSRQVRDELNNEALTFVKEQRIRCLLAGTWFPHTTGHGPESGPVTKQTVNRAPASNWRFVKLSHNRRYLHYADFDTKKDLEPTLDELADKIDLNIVSSVVSNVSASPPTTASSNLTIRDAPGSQRAPSMTTTKITIHGYVSTSAHKESVLLQLQPQTHTLASEWLDGLLMLLNQQPITAETNKLVTLIAGYGLKIRLLNVRFEDVEAEDPRLPTREGLDGDYWYDIGGMEVGL